MRHGIDFKTHSQCQRRGADPRYSAIGSLRAGSDFLHWSVGTITAVIADLVEPIGIEPMTSSLQS